MATIHGITVPTTSDQPSDHIEQMYDLAESAGVRVNKEGLRTTYVNGAIIGAAWNGVTPRREVVFAGNFTTDSGGNKYFAVDPQFQYGILELSVTNINPGFYGYFSVWSTSPHTLLNQIGIQVRNPGGSLATNTFCGAMITAVGW